MTRCAPVLSPDVYTGCVGSVSVCVYVYVLVVESECVLCWCCCCSTAWLAALFFLIHEFFIIISFAQTLTRTIRALRVVVRTTAHNTRTRQRQRLGSQYGTSTTLQKKNSNNKFVSHSLAFSKYSSFSVAMCARWKSLIFCNYSEFTTFDFPMRLFFSCKVHCNRSHWFLFLEFNFIFDSTLRTYYLYFNLYKKRSEFYWLTSRRFAHYYLNEFRFFSARWKKKQKKIKTDNFRISTLNQSLCLALFVRIMVCLGWTNDTSIRHWHTKCVHTHCANGISKIFATQRKSNYKSKWTENGRVKLTNK